MNYQTFDDESEDVTQGEVRMSGSEIKKALRFESFEINGLALIASFKHLVKCIPSLDNYTAGEVKIYYHVGGETDPQQLISAGTKVLDAILYCALKDDGKSNAIFSLNQSTVPDPQTASEIYHKSMNAFLAGLMLFVIRGSLPAKGDSGQVVKFISSRIQQYKSVGEIGDRLSSAPTHKFPAVTLLSISLSSFPDQVVGRLGLSTAGRKFVKMLDAVNSHKAELSQYQLVTGFEKKSLNILGQYSGVEYWKLFHPASGVKPDKLTAKFANLIFKNFTLDGQMYLAEVLSKAPYKAGTYTDAHLVPVIHDGDTVPACLFDPTMQFGQEEAEFLDSLEKHAGKHRDEVSVGKKEGSFFENIPGQ